MLYKVKAKIDKIKMKDFYRALTDGSIAGQEPDGAEIVNAMQQARMTEPDTLEWYETCHCDAPLKHESQSVYHKYLHDIETTLVDDIKNDLGGTSFWDCLEDKHYDDYSF